MVALLDLTSIRIGNEEYVRENNSYGLATLRNRHVTIQGGRAMLRFRAKPGCGERYDRGQTTRPIAQAAEKASRRTRFSIRRRSRPDPLPTRLPSTNICTSEPAITLQPRIFARGRLLPWPPAFSTMTRAEKLAARKRVVKKAIAAVSEALGNTPTVCRKYYIHPALIDAYLTGELAAIFQRFRAARWKIA